MSPLRPFDSRLRTADPADALADALAAAARSLATLARTAAFWLAIVLPFLHLPLLFVVGFTDATTPALVTLWACNVVALAVGAGHDPDTGVRVTPD